MKKVSLYYWTNITASVIVLALVIFYPHFPGLLAPSDAYFLVILGQLFLKKHGLAINSNTFTKTGDVALSFIVPCLMFGILAVALRTNIPYFKWIGISLFGICVILFWIIVFSFKKQKAE
ncbi:hypothetical protein [Microbacter margulisiae]|nr:hypothetical protein [Microbacter margulisiae]